MVADSNRVLSLERAYDYHDQLHIVDYLPSCFSVASALLHSRAISTRPITLVLRALSILRSPGSSLVGESRVREHVGFGKKQTKLDMLEKSRGCNYVQERNQHRSKNGVMYCSILRQPLRRPSFKQRGTCDLTSLGKRHPRRSLHIVNHTLNVPVAHRILASTTFRSIHGSWIEYLPN